MCYIWKCLVILRKTYIIICVESNIQTAHSNRKYNKIGVVLCKDTNIQGEKVS